jgi:hypothetical protein
MFKTPEEDLIPDETSLVSRVPGFNYMVVYSPRRKVFATRVATQQTTAKPTVVFPFPQAPPLTNVPDIDLRVFTKTQEFTLVVPPQ